MFYAGIINASFDIRDDVEIHINILNESTGVNCRDQFLKVITTSYCRISP